MNMLKDLCHLGIVTEIVDMAVTDIAVSEVAAVVEVVPLSG